MGSGIKVGRILGVEIGIHPSWLVIGFLVTYSLAVGQFPIEYGGWTDLQYWLVALATSVLFFASVLAHELSHVAHRDVLVMTIASSAGIGNSGESWANAGRRASSIPSEGTIAAICWSRT